MFPSGLYVVLMCLHSIPILVQPEETILPTPVLSISHIERSGFGGGKDYNQKNRQTNRTDKKSNKA